MAQTISQAQKAALKSKFLDNIGGERESNVQLEGTFAVLVDIAGYLIIQASNNLTKGGNISSGSLASSFVITDPKMEGNKITLNVTANDYYQYLNDGVKGTKSGAGKFAFKNDYPSKKMVEQIKAYLKRSKRATRNVSQTISAQETKQKSIGELSKAYAVARSIKQHGIKATGFFTKALEDTNQYAKDKLGNALKVDVINSLPDKI